MAAAPAPDPDPDPSPVSGHNREIKRLLVEKEHIENQKLFERGVISAHHEQIRSIERSIDAKIAKLKEERLVAIGKERAIINACQQRIYAFSSKLDEKDREIDTHIRAIKEYTHRPPTYDVFAMLPNELVLYILAFLPAISVYYKSRVDTVCRRFHTLLAPEKVKTRRAALCELRINTMKIYRDAGDKKMKRSAMMLTKSQKELFDRVQKSAGDPVLAEHPILFNAVEGPDGNIASIWTDGQFSYMFRVNGRHYVSQKMSNLYKRRWLPFGAAYHPVYPDLVFFLMRYKHGTLGLLVVIDTKAGQITWRTIVAASLLRPLRSRKEGLWFVAKDCKTPDNRMITFYL